MTPFLAHSTPFRSRRSLAKVSTNAGEAHHSPPSLRRAPSLRPEMPGRVAASAIQSLTAGRKSNAAATGCLGFERHGRDPSVREGAVVLHRPAPDANRPIPATRCRQFSKSRPRQALIRYQFLIYLNTETFISARTWGDHG